MPSLLASLGCGGSGAAAFDPSAIPDLSAWYKADAIVGLADGDPVPTWVDSSAGGNTATQATGAARPTYKTNIVNGKPVVRFDGVDDQMATASFFPLNADATAMTSFAVARCATTSQMHLMGDRASGSSAGWIHRLNSTAGTAWGHFAINGASQTDSVTTTNWNILQLTGTITTLATVGSFATGHNGTLQAATATPPNAFATPEAFAIGAQGASAAHANRMNGDIAEILVFTRQLTVAERDDIETYLSAKYAITVA